MVPPEISTYTKGSVTLTKWACCVAVPNAGSRPLPNHTLNGGVDEASPHS